MSTKRISLRFTLGLAAVVCCAGAGPARGQEAAAPVPVPRWSLGDVVAIALANNPAVGQADAESRAAAARRGQAASPARPQVAASGGWAWSEAPSPPGGEQERATTSSVQGSVAQLLTDFGRTGASLARAGDLAAAATHSAQAVRVEVAYAAQIAYFNVLRADAVLRVRRETVRQRENLQRQAQAFFEAGIKARIDVVRAEANLYQARADAAEAGHDARTSRLVLLNRMGLDGPAEFELAGAPAVAETAGALVDWQREADVKHPELAALRLSLEGARNGLLAADRGDRPSLAASGRVGWTGDDLPSDRSWAVGAQLNFPVFNGGLTRYETAEAASRVAAAEFALAERRRQVRLLVEQADQAMRNAAERLTVREKEREAFAENLRLATGRYEAGAADIIEMVDAQVQMTAAETGLVQARFDQLTALATLYRALGRLPQSDR